ncbi:serine hydrolase domain-containing protein [Streptomyces cellulosae]
MPRNKKPVLRGSLLVVAAAGLLSTTVTGAAEADPPSRSPLRQSLDRLVEEQKFPAALAWTSKDGRTTSLVAGSSRLGRQVPVPRDGQVRAGSNTKTFTAVVVLQLVAEGKVHLDAPVERYLPGLVRGEGVDARKITVRRSPNASSTRRACATPTGPSPATRASADRTRTATPSRASTTTAWSTPPRWSPPGAARPDN